MGDVVIHRLLKKDQSTMTGDCSVCGFVAIAKAGNGFQCGVKKKAAQQAWRAKSPGRSAADRRRRSEHELFGRDYVKLTAKCAVCGPTDLVAWGRGYICGVRGRELRTVQESEVQQFCRECQIIDGDKVYLRGGVCPRCADPGPVREARRSDWEQMEHEYAGAGFSIHHGDHDDYVDDRQPAVPGWKTIGSDRPWNEV